MRYEILGPIRVVNGSGVYTLGAPKMEVLLAALLVNADQVLTVDQLRTEIWEDDAPRRALATFQVYISQLRKFLRQAGGTGNPIVRREAGYQLVLGADELDVRVFTQLMRAGREYARAGRHEAARGAFSSALRLHHGPVVGDLGCGPVINQFRTWACEAVLECHEALIDAELALGCHQETVGRLYSLTTEHPYNETFYGQLMRALDRSGRRAEALKVYRSAGSRLMVDLGIGPSPGLREIHDSILAPPACARSRPVARR
ncbi:MAG: AfsR/SARP family transcriptional regulator [Catenulispora sp.]|nr:AfsR/SARP family transcriptional regulator [Catenulispora sp.]